MKRTLTAILYDRDGSELQSREDLPNLREAKAAIRYWFTDEWARQSAESTHASLRTYKAAVFREGDATGAERPCEWDDEHPQHRAWVAEENAKAAREEATEEEQAAPPPRAYDGPSSGLRSFRLLP